MTTITLKIAIDKYRTLSALDAAMKALRIRAQMAEMEDREGYARALRMVIDDLTDLQREIDQ